MDSSETSGAANFEEAPAGQDFACPVCHHVSERAGSLVTVLFDENADGAGKLLSPDPLHEPCDVCGAWHRILAGFVFVSVEARWAVGYVPGENADFTRTALAEALSIPPEDCVVAPELESATAAVRRHLMMLTNEALVPFQLANLEGEGERWLQSEGVRLPRATLTALLMLQPQLTPAADAAIDAGAQKALIDGRVTSLLTQLGLAHALSAIESGDDAPSALDAALPVGLLPPSAVALWDELVAGQEAGPRLRTAVALLLAWHEDRTGLARSEAAAWCWALLALEKGVAGSGQTRLPVDDDFLRRTVELEPVFDVLVHIGDPDRRMNLIRSATERQLVDPLALLRLLARKAGPEPGLAAAREVLGSESSETVALSIALLAAHGAIDESVEALTNRLLLLARTTDGMWATRAVVEALFRSGRAQEADVVGKAFLTASGEDWDAWFRGDAAVTLLNEMGNVARKLQRHDDALQYYDLALDRFDEDSPDLEKLTILMRNYAIVRREMGRPAEARSLLLELLAMELGPAQRAETYESLSLCLFHLGLHEDALRSLELALEVAAPLLPSDPRMDARLRLQIARAAQLVDDPRAEALAVAAVEAAYASDQASLAATAAAVRASMAFRKGADDREALGEEALSRLATAEQSPQSPHDRLALLSLRVEVLDASGRLDELIDLVESADDVTWELIGASAAARFRRGQSPDADLRRAWDRVIDAVTKDQLVVGDFGVLRNAAQLQRTTMDRAIERYDAAPSDATGLVAASELSASVVGSLTAWPEDSRAALAERLRQPASLLEALPERTAVLVPVDGGDWVGLVLRGPAGCELVGRWPAGRVADVELRVAAATRRSRTTGDPLASSPAWVGLQAEIGAALEKGLGDVDEVVIVAGWAMSGLPLHTVRVGGRPLCLRWPVQYVASLLQLDAIRARAAPPRVTRAGILSVARLTDPPLTQDAFVRGAGKVQAALEANGVPTTLREGAKASVEEFHELCGEVDVLAVACHGQGLPGYGLHGFLLAHNGRLPPLLMTKPSTPAALEFLLTWDEISGPVPPVILSGACSSASASFVHGGERVSLDRTLIAAGAHVVLAPLWDIAVDAGLDLLAAVTSRSLSGGTTWSSALRDVLLDASESTPPASWQSLVVNGYGGYVLA